MVEALSFTEGDSIADCIHGGRDTYLKNLRKWVSYPRPVIRTECVTRSLAECYSANFGWIANKGEREG